MKPLLSFLAGLLFAVTAGADYHPTTVFRGPDYRLGKPKTLNDYFPMQVPRDRAAWDTRRQELRKQVLVATGLWPMPEKTPLQPVIHGRIDRDGYTVEKVFFASYPGHYVTGNLYRPKGREGKLPGVLCPHGHWANGRFHDAGEARANAEIKQGAEKHLSGARHPVQARMAQLARMGCVVFHYDMVGYADSKQIAHRAGFTDAEAELRLQSFMGLQTWNSIRALDFLLSLPEVDAKRIGVTGSSGGGTQTFMLCAVDDRPAVAFPAVMVSTAMQGGCICENCSYLRQDAGNIDLAALFAPKPLGMSGAKDWTIDIETKGLPELKALYRLHDAEDNVMARCFPQFGHNYNQVSREVMYNWFNKHLQLGHPEPVTEQPFEPVPPAQLSVYDEEHPVPKDALDATGLRKVMTEISDRQIKALLPKDESSLREFRRVLGPALRVMAGGSLPAQEDVVEKIPAEEESIGKYTAEGPTGKVTFEKLTWRRTAIGRKDERDLVPAVELRDAKFDGTMVVVIHPQGKACLWKDGTLSTEAKEILSRRAGILAIDVLETGELTSDNSTPVNTSYAGFTFGYNRPLLANRVHDILTAVAYARSRPGVKEVHLLGLESAGPWVLLARSLCGDAVTVTAADGNGFRFEQVNKLTDPMLLPGALKYGGLPALTALAAPGQLLIYQTKETGLESWGKAAYAAAKTPDRVRLIPEKLPAEEVIGLLLR